MSLSDDPVFALLQVLARDNEHARAVIENWRAVRYEDEDSSELSVRDAAVFDFVGRIACPHTLHCLCETHAHPYNGIFVCVNCRRHLSAEEIDQGTHEEVRRKCLYARYIDLEAAEV